MGYFPKACTDCFQSLLFVLEDKDAVPFTWELPSPAWKKQRLGQG